ncbi:hypothetical protein [Roseovarius sp. SCSIO 43702]|nr:hypothetical protein [Roseovarius sp. SCSIO 43702]
MNELLRLARSIRCDCDTPWQAFRRRMLVGVTIAALILILSLLE